MMANRSDRRLPNVLVAQAHNEAAYAMRRRRADSIRTRTRLQGPSKVGYMRATDFSNCLQDKPSAEAGSIYAINRPRKEGDRQTKSANVCVCWNGHPCHKKSGGISTRQCLM